MPLLDAAESAALVTAGEVAPSELVEQAIRRAELVQPELGAIVATTFDQAREQAADGAAGPLAGVPILLKDLFTPVQGDPAPHGNRLLAALDARYAHTGNVARRLRDAGAISMGARTAPSWAAASARPPRRRPPSAPPATRGRRGTPPSGRAEAPPRR